MFIRREGETNFLCRNNKSQKTIFSKNNESTATEKITHHCSINSRKAACWSRSAQEKDIHTLSNSLVVVLGALQSTLCLTHKSSKICLASGIKKKQSSFLINITNPEKLDLSTVKHFAIKLQISTWSSKF